MKEQNKQYFKNVQEQDIVFGLVYGPGVVTRVFGEAYYTFEVTYKNGQCVPYTEDGIPGWNANLDYQTVYYKRDIDFFDLDMTPQEDVLSPKKIIKLRAKKELEILCPSGIWQTLDHCPTFVAERYLENNLWHLFRKIQ